MRHLNSQLEAKCAELASDVEAWLKKGNKIPLVPIIERELPDLLARQITEAKPGRRQKTITPEMVGQMLLLNKAGWTRDNIGRRVGVSRATVTRELIKAGAVMSKQRW